MVNTEDEGESRVRPGMQRRPREKTLRNGIARGDSPRPEIERIENKSGSKKQGAKGTKKSRQDVSGSKHRGRVNFGTERGEKGMARAL